MGRTYEERAIVRKSLSLLGVVQCTCIICPIFKLVSGKM